MFLIRPTTDRINFNRDDLSYAERVGHATLDYALGGVFVGLLYPFFRASMIYIAQPEQLRTSEIPTSISRSQLASRGMLHAFWRQMRIERTFRSHWYGFLPFFGMYSLTYGAAWVIDGITEPAITRLYEEPIADPSNRHHTPGDPRISSYSISPTPSGLLNHIGQDSSSPFFSSWWWGAFGAVALVGVVSELAVAPLRSLWITMASKPIPTELGKSQSSHLFPSMRTLWRQQPGLWRLGLTPFILSGVLLSTWDMFSHLQPLTFIPDFEMEDLDARSRQLVRNLPVIATISVASWFLYISGMRTVIDAQVLPQASQLPVKTLARYPSWTTALRVHLGSGPRTLFLGWLGLVLIGSVFGACQGLIPGLEWISQLDQDELLQLEADRRE